MLKIVINTYRTIIFVQPMKRLNMHSKGPIWARGGEGARKRDFVLLFPLSSLCVLQNVPNNTALLYHMYALAKVELSYIYI